MTNPTELRQRLSLFQPESVFIDEIQRLPSLLDTIQALIDESGGSIQFLLTGSSARKLKRGAANLLPGRVFTYRLGPLSLLDLDYNMDSLRALQLGCLPEPYLMTKPSAAEKLLRSYTATYLREEILVEALVRDLQGFSNFLNTVAANSGLFLDFSKLANRSRVNRSSARRYYEILEDTLICDRLESYFDPNDEEKSKRLVRHAKYYLFDVGIKNGILQNFNASQDRIGFLFEHLFFNQVRNISYSLDREIKVSHFRTHSGIEIDFIFEFVFGEKITVELKTSEPGESDVKKIERTVQEYIPGAEIYVACLSCHPKRIRSAKVLNWQIVLKEIFERLV